MNNLIKLKNQIVFIGVVFVSTLCISNITFAAQTQFEEMFIGDVKTSQFTYNHYTLYEVEEQTFISISTLKALGYSIDESNPIWCITLDNKEKVDQSENIENHTITGKAYMSKTPIYCGNIRSYALKVEDDILIPIEALQALGQLYFKDNNYSVEIDFQNPLQLIKIDEDKICNLTDHIMWLVYKQIYWHERQFKTFEDKILLNPNESFQYKKVEDKNYLYITTVIEEMSEWPINRDSTNYGQQQEKIFKKYSDSIYLRYLTTLFPPYILTGEMIYPVGTLQAKEAVEIYRSEKHEQYIVKDKNGKLIPVPYQSVHIIGEKGTWVGTVSDKMIEDFATLSQIQSDTDYLIWTDLYRQRTYILKNEEGKWHLEKKFICSSGKKDNPTPSGFYEVEYKIPYIGVNRGFRCKYALVFFRDYMYHSILFDKTGTYVKSGQYELGSRASHGCIRLSEKDSKWMHTTIPVKTKVWIR